MHITTIVIIILQCHCRQHAWPWVNYSIAFSSKNEYSMKCLGKIPCKSKYPRNNQTIPKFVLSHTAASILSLVTATIMICWQNRWGLSQQNQYWLAYIATNNKQAVLHHRYPCRGEKFPFYVSAPVFFKTWVPYIE